MILKCGVFWRAECQKKGTSVLQLQGTEFCNNLNEKEINLPQGLQKRGGPACLRF